MMDNCDIFGDWSSNYSRVKHDCGYTIYYEQLNYRRGSPEGLNSLRSMMNPLCGLTDWIHHLRKKIWFNQESEFNFLKAYIHMLQLRYNFNNKSQKDYNSSSVEEYYWGPKRFLLELNKKIHPFEVIDRSYQARRLVKFIIENKPSPKEFLDAVHIAFQTYAEYDAQNLLIGESVEIIVDKIPGIIYNRKSRQQNMIKQESNE